MSTQPPQTERGWYPLFHDLRQRQVLVIGGNETAARKIRRLLAVGARVRVVAPLLEDDVAELVEQKRVVWLGRRLRRWWLRGQALVLIAEASPELCERLHRWGKRSGVPVNAVDQPAYCTAIVPAVVDRSPLTIAIGSGGQAPELARRVRSRIEQWLPQSLGSLAALSGQLAEDIRGRFPELALRRRFLDWVFSGPPADAIQRGQNDQAAALVRQALDRQSLETPARVSLVGAGPGEPELLTLRALDRIQSADVLVHDGLVDPRILDYARRDAELIDVAKRPGDNGVGQVAIQRILIKRFKQGKRVVRLKGGDPMVFGRAGEELAALRGAGIDFEIIPGVTAASACASYAGLSLTQRGMAQSVRLVTAHCERSIDRLDWPALAKDRQTLAFYMAVAQLERIQQQLTGHGRAADTPFALVENGSRPNQRVIVGQLGELALTARHFQASSPAMLFIGEVAAQASEFHWFGEPPLCMDTGELALVGHAANLVTLRATVLA